MSPVTNALQPICLITGASAGIGAALARVFAGHGHVLVLTARREAQLTALADEIAAAGHARPRVITADLGAPDTVEGRFELYNLHVVLLLRRLRGEGPLAR